MRLSALLSESVSVAGRLAVLALVPLVTSLARGHDVVALATRPGRHYNVSFGFPHPLAGLWTFVDPPSPAGGDVVSVDLPVVVDAGVVASAAASAAVFLVGAGLLMAGYVGSINQYLEEGRFEFLENVRVYGRRMVGFQAAVLAASVALVLPVIAAPPLFVVSVVAMLALAFLFFLAPYLVVVSDLGLLEAFERSPELATGRGEPIAFFAVYALVVAAGSFPLSAAVNGGFPGVLLAALLASGAGLVLTTFTVRFVRELVAESGDESGTGSGTSRPGAAPPA